MGEVGIAGMKKTRTGTIRQLQCCLPIVLGSAGRLSLVLFSFYYGRFESLVARRAMTEVMAAQRRPPVSRLVELRMG